jgi:hypothetical protein
MQSGGSGVWRIEVIGRFLLPGGGERWKVLVFNDQGTLVDSYDAYSEQDALTLKEELAKRLAGP